MPLDLADSLPDAALAFRGYNTTNLGRTPELLAHPCYGGIMREQLAEASAVCAEVLAEPVDLAADVESRRPTTLETFGRDIGMIMAVELAQIRLLEEFFGVTCRDARIAFGYSLGEVAALACSGVFTMADALTPLVAMSKDCAELAKDVTMGVLFSRGPALDLDAVERLCTVINADGQGLIGVSAYLSPNTALMLGQGSTVDRFVGLMHDVMPGRVHLRKNQDRWPPLHTPLLWAREIPNRAAMMLLTMRGGLTLPQPAVMSLAAPKARYNDYNARRLMIRWIDHPQHLWDAIYETLSMAVTTVIHIGPEPNLIPATYKRLSDNVQVQLSGRTFNSLRLRAVSSLWRPWLSKVLSSRTALLHAPYVKHILLEDWLLENEPVVKKA